MDTQTSCIIKFRFGSKEEKTEIKTPPTLNYEHKSRLNTDSNINGHDFRYIQTFYWKIDSANDDISPMIDQIVFFIENTFEQKPNRSSLIFVFRRDHRIPLCELSPSVIQSLSKIGCELDISNEFF